MVPVALGQCDEMVEPVRHVTLRRVIEQRIQNRLSPVCSAETLHARARWSGHSAERRSRADLALRLPIAMGMNDFEAIALQS